MYTVAVTAELPAENGSRRAVTDSLDWELNDDAGDLLVTITDDGVRVSGTRIDG